MVLISFGSKRIFAAAAFALFLLISTCLGCNSNDSTVEKNEQLPTEVSEPLFPFQEFISSELTYLEATPFAVQKIVVEDGMMIDSVLIAVNDVQEIAKEFTGINPNEKQWRDQFTENSFVDMTLGYNTFVITALTTNVPLRQATILVHPETNEVERLVLEIISAENVQKRLTWRKHKSLQIVELFPENNKPQTRITRVVWDE